MTSCDTVKDHMTSCDTMKDFMIMMCHIIFLHNSKHTFYHFNHFLMLFSQLNLLYNIYYSCHDHSQSVKISL